MRVIPDFCRKKLGGDINCNQSRLRYNGLSSPQRHSELFGGNGSLQQRSWLSTSRQTNNGRHQRVFLDVKGCQTVKKLEIVEFRHGLVMSLYAMVWCGPLCVTP